MARLSAAGVESKEKRAQCWMAPTWKPSWKFLADLLVVVGVRLFVQKAGIGGVVVARSWTRGTVVDGVVDDKITVANESGGGAFRADRAMVGCGGGTMHWAFVRFFLEECRPRVWPVDDESRDRFLDRRRECE